ncbi:MAG: sulfatase [Bacteroidales bacterium]
MILLNTLLTASTMAAVPAQEVKQPNVVVFLIDDMGVMDTSVPFLPGTDGNPVKYPLNEWYRTPNMERMAQNGIRFSTFYAQSVSSPSRASLLTGKNSARHHTTTWINPTVNNRTQFGPPAWNWEGIRPDTQTLPKVLSESGYRSILVGKAHFGPKGSFAEDPLNIGFDVNIGGCGTGQPGSYYGEDGYGNIKGSKVHAVPGLEKYHGTDTFLTEALTLEANAEVSKAVKDNKPFFLYMSHYAVHSPFQPDKRFIANYSDSDKSNRAKAYASLVEGMDKSLGDLMDHLEKEGVAENTLILFLGDNGGDAPLGEINGHFSSAPLRGKKGSVYEGGTRVPFLACWAKPDASNEIQKAFPIEQGGVQMQPGTIMDLFPTILKITGANVPAGEVIDGIPLDTQFKGKFDKKRKGTVLMHFPHGEHNGNYFTTFRNGDWKIIYQYNPSDPANPQVALYNLKKDPFENNDVSKQEPKRVRTLVKELAQALEKEGAQYPVDKDGNEIRPLIR